MTQISDLPALDDVGLDDDLVLRHADGVDYRAALHLIRGQIVSASIHGDTPGIVVFDDNGYGQTMTDIDEGGSVDKAADAEHLGGFDGEYYLTHNAIMTLDDSDDLNDVTEPGWYGWAEDAPANAPGSKKFQSMVVWSSAGELVVQTVKSNDTPALTYERVRQGKDQTWHDWVQYLHTGNIDRLSGAQRQQAIGSTRKRGMRVTPHRGVHLKDIAPEDSLDSAMLSARFGFDTTECDIHVTKDGEYVLMHDDTINRTMRNASDDSKISGAVKIAEHTLADLRDNYVYASPYKRKRKPIATLHEMLDVCRYYGLIPIIEFKRGGFTRDQVEEVTNLCIAALGRDGVYFQSFTHKYMDWVREVEDRIVLYYLGSSVDRADGHQPCLIFNRSDDFSANITKDAALKDVGTAAYTPTPADFNDLLDLGVDEITSNDIAPNLNTQKLVFQDYSDGKFEQYDTNGTVQDGVLVLDAGQAATITGPQMDMGAYYLAIEFEGAGHIDANYVHMDISGPRFRTQAMQVNAKPSFMTVTAGQGGLKLNDAFFAVAKF